MLVNLPSKFIDKFYGKTSSEIDAIVEEALEAFFSEDKPESSPANAVADFKSDLTLRLMMEVADKLDALQSQGMVISQEATQKPAEKKVVKYEEPEFEKGAAGQEDIDDFLFGIMK